MWLFSEKKKYYSSKILRQKQNPTQTKISSVVNLPEIRAFVEIQF